MISFLEQFANLRMAGISDILHHTWQNILTKLSVNPILLLPFDKVPFMYEKALEVAVEETNANEYEAVLSDLNTPITQSKTLFFVAIKDRDRLNSMLDRLLEHFIQSKGKSNFVILIARKLIDEMKREEQYVLIKPYIDQFQKISEDPYELLSWITDMRDPYPYSSRLLSDLIFTAAVSKYEGKWITEDEIEHTISSINGFYLDDEARCFFSGASLPKLHNLRELYFKSIGFPDNYFNMAQLDNDFYITAYIHGLPENKRNYVLARLSAGMSDEELSVISEFTSIVQRLDQSNRIKTILNFLFRTAINYILTQESEPTQRIGITGRQFEEDPLLKDELIWISSNAFPSTMDAIDKEDWTKLGSIMQHRMYSLAIPEGLDLNLAIMGLEEIIEEYIKRIPDYSSDLCKQLLAKTTKAAYYIETVSKLMNCKPKQKLHQAFIRLMKGCLKAIPAQISENDTEWNNLIVKINIISEFNPIYTTIKDYISTTQTRNHINARFNSIAEAMDPVDGFFEFYAAILKDLDFLSDPHLRNELGACLARPYIKLDEKLRKQIPPFSSEFRERKNQISLISQLSIHDYDRIFILVIDGFSFLDWKIAKPNYVDLDCDILEDYRISPVPTYTPCALTALITSYHPSLTGVCDWRIRTKKGEVVDLTENVNLNDLHWNSGKLQKRNSLLLAHSLSNTPLTQIQANLADIEISTLPSAGHEKTIAQAAKYIYDTDFKSKLLVLYIPDFDEFGHKYLTFNSFGHYYETQSERIKNGLLKPIIKRSRAKSEKTLIILTADHGKLTRFESNILATEIEQTDSFNKCKTYLSQYDMQSSRRHIIAWINENEFNSVVATLEKDYGKREDLAILYGEQLKLFFPQDSNTEFKNPNLMILSLYSTGGQNISHGGASLSEVIIPAISFTC